MFSPSRFRYAEAVDWPMRPRDAGDERMWRAHGHLSAFAHWATVDHPRPATNAVRANVDVIYPRLLDVYDHLIDVHDHGSLWSPMAVTVPFDAARPHLLNAHPDLAATFYALATQVRHEFGLELA